MQEKTKFILHSLLKVHMYYYSDKFTNSEQGCWSFFSIFLVSGADPGGKRKGNVEGKEDDIIYKKVKILLNYRKKMRKTFVMFRNISYVHCCWSLL
jgi:hypothetical protein